MIVVGMNRDELQQQVSKDFMLLQRYIDGQANVFHSMFRRNKQIDSHIIKWVSPNSNQWQVILTHDKNGISTIYFTCMESDACRFVMRPQLTRGGYSLVIYLPHFFKRYRERMKLDRKMTTEQVIRCFFRRNRTAHMEFSKSVKYGVEVAYHDGVGLGNMLSLRQRLMRTFITFGMAYGDQVERFSENVEHRKEFCDRFDVYDDEVRKEIKTFGLSDEDFMSVKVDKILEKHPEIKNKEDNGI